MHNKYKYISTATTTEVCSKPCILSNIVLTETAAGTITINDGTTTVAVLKASIVEQTYKFDIMIENSLSIVTAGASKLTVAYRPTAP